MAIDFFDSNCKSQTSEMEFGIVDMEPAKLSFSDNDKWNVTINNPNEVEVTHTAVDKCLDIPFEAGKRCDSMLTYSSTIVFLEIKERKYSGWSVNAKEQLVNTISIFKNAHSLDKYTRLYGQISNIKRPSFRQNLAILSQTFEDETGFILRVCTTIDIN